MPRAASGHEATHEAPARATCRGCVPGGPFHIDAVQESSHTTAHEEDPPPPVNVVQPPTGDEGIDQQVNELVKRWGYDHSPELIEEMVGTVLKMAQDRMSVADLKMYNRSLKELRYAARLFAQYKPVRKVSVFGSARTVAGRARVPGRRAVRPADERGGLHDHHRRRRRHHGRGAAWRGARPELRVEHPPALRAGRERDHRRRPKLVNFNYFFTRKLNFMKESHAIALFPGGFGTMDEGFEALTLLQTGKAKMIPLVLVDEPNGHYWETWYEFMRGHLLKLGLISEEDFHLFRADDRRGGGGGRDRQLLQDLSIQPLRRSADGDPAERGG